MADMTARPFDAIGYLAAQWQSINRNTEGNGVIPTGGRFVVSTPGPTKIAVTSGAAWVDGVFCEDPSSTTKSFTAPDAPTGGHVVLRVDRVAKTATIEVVLSASGTTAIPGLTTIIGGTYEIRLAWFLTDSAGTVSNLTDTRPFLRPGNLVIARQGGNVGNWSIAGTTTYMSRSNGIYPGVLFVDETGAVAQVSGYTKEVAVAFPPNTFIDKPQVFVSGIAPGSQSSEIWTAGAINPTVNGFTMRVIMQSLDGNSANIPWLAIGPT